MRPIELKLKNIGPFLEQTVDFDNLGNMFIITGNTGAGKTFIFDAMTYALYGALAGNRGGREKDIKSRYAEEGETEYYVEFTFCVAREVYKVLRTVEYTKQGNKNPTASTVSLYRRETDGSFSDMGKGLKKSDIDAKIKEIIGLNINEFSQVILLPQGAFAEFLKQNSTQRGETLKKLFPVQDYSNLMKQAKLKVDQFKEQKAILDGTLTSERKSLNDLGITFETASENIEEMKNELDFLEMGSRELNKRVAEITGLESNLLHDLEDAERNNINIQQLELLESKKEYYKELEEKVCRAEKANALREYIVQKDNAVKDLDVKSQSLSDMQEKKNEISETLVALESKSADMENLKEANGKAKTALDIMQQKIQKIPEYLEVKKSENVAAGKKERGETELESLNKKISDVQKYFAENNFEKVDIRPEEVIQTLQDKIVELNKLFSEAMQNKKSAQDRDLCEAEFDSLCIKRDEQQSKVREQEAKVERTKNSLEDKKQKMEEFRLRHGAYALVNALKPGCPCPVCGSIEHPVPATAPEGLLDPAEEVQVYEAALQKENSELEKLKSVLAVLVGKIEAQEKELAKFGSVGNTDQIIKEYEEAEKKLSEAQNKLEVLKEKYAQLADWERDYKAAESALSNSKTAWSVAKTKREELEKDLGSTPDELTKSFGILEKEYESNVNAYEDWYRNLVECRNQKSAVESSIEVMTTTVLACKELVKKSEAVLVEKISESEFSSDAEAQNAMMDLQEISRSRDECQNYDKQIHSLKDAIKNARKVDLPENIKKELNKLELEKNSISEQIGDILKETEQKKKLYVTVCNSYDKIKDKVAEKQELDFKAEPYEKLYENLSGKNPAGVPFDVWALGMYFEQVVDFASTRFFEISDNRFEFVLKDLGGKSGGGYKGLDLMVFDHNQDNNNIVDASTLSGGETFEASISLALAITDVVQNNNGGIVLDSLFIDEGFGTLDSELLDKTINILKKLSETKMIGVISHVESLQDEDTGFTGLVDIQKTNEGSFIK